MAKIILVSNTEWYLYNYRLALGKFLRAQGHEVVWVSPPGPYAEKLAAQGFRWRPWDLGRKTLAPWTELSAIAAITKIYRQETPDLVHHNTIKPSIYGSIAAQRAGVKGIVNSITGRGYVFLGGDLRSQLIKPLAHGLYRYAFRSKNCAAIFENDSDRQYFIDQRLIPAERSHLIESSGVDPGVFEAWPEPQAVPVVMLPSRMLWDKGVGVLVEAARLLKDRVEARVVLVGDPDDGNPAAIPAATLSSWSDEGIIEWWGFQADMPQIYRQSHIVTLPTMYAEGLPVALLEGAATARPLVGTTTPGCQDFILDGETGFLVPPGDASALADALEKLINDPDLRGRMGAAGRQRVLDGYTHESVNQRTLAIYRALLDPT
jgi:glycosyltransferase involved in cell wall biosynthesis